MVALPGLPVKVGVALSPNLGKKLFLLVSPRYTVEKSAGGRVRVLVRTLALIVVSLWLLPGVACTSDTASTQVPTAMGAPGVTDDRPNSRVSKALGSVSLEFSGQVVEFADYSGSRAVKGLEDADSSEDLYRLDPSITTTLPQLGQFLAGNRFAEGKATKLSSVWTGRHEEVLKVHFLRTVVVILGSGWGSSRGCGFTLT